MIGIGHRLPFAAGDVIEQERKLSNSVMRTQHFEIGEIMGVERDNMGETPKILRRHLPCAQPANLHTMFSGNGLGPRVRRMANVPVSGPGRIDMETKSPSVGLDPKRRFGQRRAADIAQADEKNRNRHVCANTLAITSCSASQSPSVIQRTME